MRALAPEVRLSLTGSRNLKGIAFRSRWRHKKRWFLLKPCPSWNPSEALGPAVFSIAQVTKRYNFSTNSRSRHKPQIEGYPPKITDPNCGSKSLESNVPVIRPLGYFQTVTTASDALSEP